jgi:predicted deacylase
MSVKKFEPEIRYESYTIPPMGTHNTIPPFPTKLVRGEEAEINVIKVIGKEPGPELYVGGGTHGDEINGIEAVLRIPQEIDINKLVGSLTLVPIQNPVAYKFRTRLNPYDPIDPDWVSPGDPMGTYNKRVKHLLDQLASSADCVIDLHTAGRGGTNNPMIYVPPEIGNGAGENSLKLSKVFGGDRIIQGAQEIDYGWPVQFAMPFIAVRKGKMGLYPEAGEGGAGTPEEKFVKYFVTGVFNVMKMLNMVEGKVVLQGERIIVDPLKEKAQSARANKAGIFNPYVQIGEKVQKGQLLGEIHVIPKGIEQITAPIGGLVTWLGCFGPTAKGDRLVTVSSYQTE